jgi:hypothetical protein
MDLSFFTCSLPRWRAKILATMYSAPQNTGSLYRNHRAIIYFSFSGSEKAYLGENCFWAVFSGVEID